MTRNLCVATVQFQHQAGNKDHNLSRIEHFARQAATSGAQLVCMPEMCISGYWHVPFLNEAGLHAIAESVDGPSVLRVASLAQHLDLAIGVTISSRTHALVPCSEPKSCWHRTRQGEPTHSVREA